MRTMKPGRTLIAILLVLCGLNLRAAGVEPGFTSLFDGTTLHGWMYRGKAGAGYVPKEGALVCPADGGGDLLTEKEYSDFVFRFEFKLDKGGNNGVGIRTPLDGNLSYTGMEIQILDQDDAMYKEIKPWQAHGSVYGVVAAKRGALRPVGAWNREEIRCEGRRIKVTLNGTVIVNSDLSDVTDPAKIAEHPGILREKGHVGFLGHGPSEVQFRDIRIQELPPVEKDNAPPHGFVALFNGRDLSGWKALVADPPTRAKMGPTQMAEAQQRADAEMRSHWKAEDGVIVYDGKNNSLCTAKDYGDFELWVDWKIEAGGDSGIYLRGSPQVQIWDAENHPGRPGEGSGGLYNNQKSPSGTLKIADKPAGQWNRFKILMIGDKVTVTLNGELVVDRVTLENYWERDKPIYPTGQIELQHHGSVLHFKNIYIREIPRI